jgi:hypothetical protein
MTSMLRARTLIATIVVGLLLGGTADLAAGAAGPGKKQSQTKKHAKKKHCKKPKRGKKRKGCKKRTPGKKPPATTKPPVVPPEKVFKLTAEGTYEFTRERQGTSVFFGATTRLRWTATGSVAVARTSAGPKDLRARTVSFAGNLAELEEDTMTRAATPRPDGSWVICETTSSERLTGPAPLTGTMVGARPDVLGPSFLDADVAIDRQASGTADPICLPPFGNGPGSRHVYPMDLVWLPPVESDWTFMCRHEGSFETGWVTSCRQTANRAGREVWEFAVSLTP